MQFVTTLRTWMHSVFPGAIFASLLLLAAASASAQVFTDDFSYAAAAPLNGAKRQMTRITPSCRLINQLPRS